MLELEF